MPTRKMLVNAFVLRVLLCAASFGVVNVPIVCADADIVKGKSVSEALADLLPAQCFHSGKFIEDKYVPGFSNSLHSAGEFIFSCKHGLVWAKTSPVTDALVYGKKSKYFLIDKNNVSTPIKGRVHRELGGLLNRLLGGDVRYFEKYFLVSQENNAVKMMPKKKRMAKFIDSIQISIVADKKTASPVLGRGDNKTRGVTVEEKILIQINQSNDESTHIHIFDTRTYESLRQSDCDHVTSLASTACRVLTELK